MQTTNLTMTLAALAVSASALLAAPAHAHIDMVGALKSRGGDQKSFPCDGKRGDGPVYTFAPGTTIVLSANESIPHPSYFRIAFDDDKDDNFIEPKSIKPIEASRKCPFDADDQCGESDFCNVTSDTGGATVLWDNLDPHPSGGGKTWTWSVKLPDVECDNCTIQVLQIMEDTVHGAYCPQGSCAASGDSLDDIYHRCIDIKLVKGATNGAGATTEPVKNTGMQCSAKEAPPTMTGSDAGVTSAADAGSSADAGAAKDAGGSKPAPRDAGSPSTGGDGDDDDDDTTSPASSTKDAGKSTKKDAGTSSDDDDSDGPTASSAKLDDGGCSVATSPVSASGAMWSLLALGALLVRRKRDRTA
jgi:MYXO-CTERM domain-containing protein